MTDVNTENLEVEEVVNQPAQSVEEQLALITEELNKKQDLIRQLRKYEKSQKEQAQKALEEQGKYKELYESATEKLSAYELQVKNNNIERALDDELKSHNVKSIDTIKKLIDRNNIDVSEDGVVNSESIKNIISQLKETDSILFEIPEVKVPVVKRASDESNVASFETELRSAKNQKDITAILKKYNKI